MGPPPYFVRRQGRQRACLIFDAVRSQTARFRAGGENETARRVQTEVAGDRFGRYVPDRGQPPGGVNGKSRDAVVASIGHIQEFRRRDGRYEMNLGAGVTRGVPVRQGRDRLHSGEAARCGVQTIAGDTTALFVGEIDEILGGMKAIVAGTQAFSRLDPERRVGVRWPLCASNLNCKITLAP
jgi:hypothetical protein